MAEIKEAHVLAQIAELEKLANAVLEKKRRLRPRRPIVIEFSGSPKSGKSSCISSLDIFLRRNKFKTIILTERASVCPINNKFDPLFNVWTGCSSLNQLSEILDSSGRDYDIVIMDRGFFDSLCWFEWQKTHGFLREEDYDRFVGFFTAPRFRMMVDLVLLFSASPKVSIDREYKNLLTRKEGSIMRENVLSSYLDASRQAEKKHKKMFRAIEEHNTDKNDQNGVSYEVTKKVLNKLNEVADEKIAFVEKSALSNIDKTIFDYNSIRDAVQKNIKFEFRDQVEANKNLVQFIPIAVIKDRDANRFMTGRKASKAVSQASPERDKVLLYFGGHVREEDQTLFDNPSELSVLKQCLYREVKEELGIDIDHTDENPTCIWLKDGSKSEEHIAVVFIIERKLDHIKFAISDEEFVRWEKKGTPGTGDIVDAIELVSLYPNLDTWSQNIISGILKLSASKQADAKQKDFFREPK